MVSSTIPPVTTPANSLTFRQALGQFATGITVVTVEYEPGKVHGMTANSFTSVSLDPLLISVCVDQRAVMLPFLCEQKRFGVNVLKEHQQAISEFFAQPGQNEDTEDRLNIRFCNSPSGVPLLLHANRIGLWQIGFYGCGRKVPPRGGGGAGFFEVGRDPDFSSGVHPANPALRRTPRPKHRSFDREFPRAPGRISAAYLRSKLPPAGPSTILRRIQSCDGSIAYARSEISGTVHQTPPAPPPRHTHRRGHIPNRKFSPPSGHAFSDSFLQTNSRWAETCAIKCESLETPVRCHSPTWSVSADILSETSSPAARSARSSISALSARGEIT